MKLRHSACALLFATSVGCGDPVVETRGCNDTGFDFASLTLDSFTGVLANGACTPYEPADGAVYRYTYVRFVVGQDEFTIQPIDFVGETPLDEGRWSYRLTISDYAARRANVMAVAD